MKATGLTSNADAVVYVQEAPAGQPPAPTTMDQRKFQFLPHVLPVMVGTTVKFLNSDPTPHNVFSPDYEKYNLGTWPQGQSKDTPSRSAPSFRARTRNSAGSIPRWRDSSSCSPTRTLRSATARATTRLRTYPPAHTSLAVWHPKLKAKPTPVTVAAGKNSTVDLVLAK